MVERVIHTFYADGKEVKERGCEDMSKALTDQEVEAEIARLKESPYVKLARKEHALRYRKRTALYNLRLLEKKGRELEAAGITMEILNGMVREENEGLGVENFSDAE